MENYKIYFFQNINNISEIISRKNQFEINWYYDDISLNNSFNNAIYDAWLNNYKYIILVLCNNINDFNYIINLSSIDLINNNCIIYTKNKKEDFVITNNDIVYLDEIGIKFLLDYYNGKSPFYINYQQIILNEISNKKNIDYLVNISKYQFNKPFFNNKTLKIGSFGFFDQMINKNEKYKKSNFVQEILINTLIDHNINCEYVNPFESECDICFYSLFNYNYNIFINRPAKMDFCKYIMKDIIGYPIFIYYTPENEDYAWTKIHNKYYINKGNNYSISFFQDSTTNLYFPLWVQRLYQYDWFYYRKTNIKLNQKNKFCTYIVSNPEENTKRDEIFEYISKNYKKIDSIGSHLNNQIDNFILPKEDFKETSLFNLNYHKQYKFNLCCENSNSSNNLDYITEKIINAFLYKTIPIYYGCNNIYKYFNKNAFININNLNNEEIINKIQEIDNNDELYYNMLNSYPFNELKNYKFIYQNKIYEFIKNILVIHKYIIEQYEINSNLDK